MFGDKRTIEKLNEEFFAVVSLEIKLLVLLQNTLSINYF
jgi:hypothetical protein